MLFFYFFVSLGLCYIIKYSSLLENARKFLSDKSNLFSELFQCSMCLGFWCGVALIPFLWDYQDLEEVSLLYPFATASFCWTMDILMDTMIAIITIAKEERK